MKRLFIAVIVLGAMVWAGWLKFGRTDGDPSVTLDTSKVKEDTQQAVQKGKDVLQEVGEKIESKTEELTPVE